MAQWGSITTQVAIDNLRQALSPLLSQEITNLQIPKEAAIKFEPSQIGTIVGTLTDALLPYLALSVGVGLHKSIGILGDREGYPDFTHDSGYRIELKGLFKDNPAVNLKKPPTRREPSARLTQKVTLKNVREHEDALLVVAYHLDKSKNNESLLSPHIIDLEIIPVIECIRARDHRLTASGGRWFGDYETPTILSKAGKRKLHLGQPLNTKSYGRKESEGYDYNEDTNFGKLKRIPHKPLQTFLAKHGASFASKGDYPAFWQIGADEDFELLSDDETE